MKCSRCNSELKLGCMYCSVCGKEVQIVSDYNLLEDDFLNSLLKEEKSFSKKEKSTSKKTIKKRNRKKLLMLILLIIIVLIVAAIVVATLLVNHRNATSFAYQYKKAVTFLEEKDYSSAITYFEQAKRLDGTSLDVYEQLSDLYLLQGNTQDATQMLNEIISMDINNRKAYEKLIQIYKEKKDFDTMIELSRKPTDQKVLDLFLEFQVTAPVFDRAEGTFSDYITVGISVLEGCTAYYTMDGSSPKENGTLYKAPITLDLGTTTIRTISCNQYDIYSDETVGEYTIKLKKPDMPNVLPDGGIFTSQELITVHVPEGCEVYYTWDDSTPTTTSEKYREPLYTPPGNNILALILVDKYDMVSDVLKCNYVYLPSIP
ncbi:chitobiase/beta-hexosaminidase C-terminal domain-containing protein [Lachnospiraceae bacterium ZAX-1]